MATLKIPSLQHLARNWDQDPVQIANRLVRLALRPPFFNYNKLYGAIFDLILFAKPYDDVVEGIRRAEKRKTVQANLLSVLPLLRDYFDGISPDFIQRVAPRYYPVGRGLLIPFQPPLIYGVGGQIYFPWFSFWRSNPLTAESLSLFVTLVCEILMQDPDLDNVKFSILDFSAPKTGKPRELLVIDSNDIERLSEQRKVEMLAILAEGYLRAKNEIESMHAPHSDMRNDKEAEKSDPNQYSLFEQGV